MKAFVITLTSVPKSVEVAKRCQESAAAVGLDAYMSSAVTPANNPRGMMEAEGLPVERFEGNKFSRLEPCLATFLSHAALWRRVENMREGDPLLLSYLAPTPPRSR